MNEEYLHFIWKKKRLPLHRLKTHDGQAIDFIEVGLHNESESGPDFTMAKIRIGEIIWVGCVEIHIRSSDWYRHNHHKDKAYDNVILHVVYVHDRDVEQNHRAIPVVELKPHIDLLHYFKYKKIFKIQQDDFPCQPFFSKVELIKFSELKNQAIQNRFDRKADEINLMNCESETNILFKLTAKAFGTRVNDQPFEELSNVFSIDKLNRLGEKDTQQILENFSWKRKGLNPTSCYQKRISQFLSFVNMNNFDFPFWELPPSLIVLHFEKVFKQAMIESRFIQNNLLINCIARFLFWKGHVMNIQVYKEKALKLLTLLPKESNRVMRKWETLNVIPKNALDSQALLEIYEQLCTKKACLKCEIGKMILVK